MFLRKFSRSGVDELRETSFVASHAGLWCYLRHSKFSGKAHLTALYLLLDSLLTMT